MSWQERRAEVAGMTAYISDLTDAARALLERYERQRRRKLAKYWAAYAVVLRDLLARTVGIGTGAGGIDPNLVFGRDPRSGQMDGIRRKKPGETNG